MSISGAVALICVLLSGCSGHDGESAARQNSGIHSVRTGLNGESCRTEIDRNDPNGTPYAVCPGVAGYSLLVRHVGSGRKSIEIVDPARRVFPLHYDEFVTRHMSTLDEQATWRVATKDGAQIPIALTVGVRAREDNNNPEKVTSSYLAVAKITPDEACVTDRIREGARSDAEVRKAADSAREKPCAPAQPPITPDGALIR